jgi:hypothetical protein
MAAFSHNSWCHEHMKHTPHELLIRINPTASITIPEDSISAVQECLQTLQQARSEAQKALQKQSKPVNPSHSFVTGDKVWLDAHHLHIKTPFRKLSPRRYRPYKVLKRMSPVTYHIQLPGTMRIHPVFHVDLLIPHHETEAYGEQYTQPPPVLIDGEQEYTVEEIIADRTHRHKRQYLVKWEGYPDSENSWVNKKDLHTDELLNEYRCSKA